jgi:nucleoside-diphosphate-sugar epimerase
MTGKASETVHTPESVLITGGGGFLGKAIVRILAARGDRVASFSRRRYRELDRIGIEQITGDIRDPESVSSACRGRDVVYHTAAKAGVWGDPAEYSSINVKGTGHVVAACRKWGISRLIHTSSPSVVFDGRNMEGVDESVPYPFHYDASYPATKAAAEKRVRQAAAEGLPVVILRPHLIWGPEDNHLVPRILQRAGSLMRIGDGKNRVDVLYIDNAAEAHVLAADSLKARPELSGRVYFLSQGEPVLLWDMVNGILKAGGFPPIRWSMSSSTALRLGAAMEWLYRTFHLPGEPRLTRFTARELSTSHWFDIRAAQRDLEYVPRVSIREGLARLETWLREQPGT